MEIEKIPKSIGVCICLHCGFRTLYKTAPDECNDCASSNLIIKQYLLNETCNDYRGG